MNVGLLYFGRLRRKGPPRLPHDGGRPWGEWLWPLHSIESVGYGVTRLFLKLTWPGHEVTRTLMVQDDASVEIPDDEMGTRGA